MDSARRLLPVLASLLLGAGALGVAALDDEDYERHVEALSARLPGAEFNVVVERPFVVVGDEDPEVVRRRARGTVRWAVDRLREGFFRKEPAAIIDVWLFRDRESYERNAGKLFLTKPHSPYGYYSRRDRALVMNIATGGGTLVHEIVHPFVEADFPECPPWVNEGLGSLFEACTERDGVIVGLLNWRLPVLKEAVRAGALPTIERLAAMDGGAFYGAGRGKHYAMARYLLYRLQEDGLLRRFYREFREGHEEDPTGYRTLVRLLDAEDMAAWQRDWERWALGLGE